ncbi:tRNA N(3)-methylcytidine methyltransferase METTL6 [Pseudolycoriella hygida]|uniref:tRNA N(3)-methylcytidine methyltransferase n=1 Tax=Pseudolycoriella hygida TaxID=35572 RepID=A0A9Q0MMV7_9DIPT|nr:tRNA N(3)-methylcytidine methyltransferase METTL6 [Pseudolycoriella hygida]
MDLTNNFPDEIIKETKSLTEDEKQKLASQSSRLVPEYQANQLEKNAQKHWDLFYKRNETRFFKDRRWTTREFVELLDEDDTNAEPSTRKYLLEVGCGVGNLVFPLIEEQKTKFFFYACDFSPRAVEFVKQNALYDENVIKAFQCDVTKANQLTDVIPSESLDIVTMIFVLSAIHPDNFAGVFETLFKLLKPGGVLLFRDYGLYDMAQLRFKAGHKIDENFYMRQDGTRSYYFSDSELSEMVKSVGFEVKVCGYVHRRTINVKEKIDTPRIFIQGKFIKPQVTINS